MQFGSYTVLDKYDLSYYNQRYQDIDNIIEKFAKINLDGSENICSKINDLNDLIGVLLIEYSQKESNIRFNSSNMCYVRPDIEYIINILNNLYMRISKFMLTESGNKIDYYKMSSKLTDEDEKIKLKESLKENFNNLCKNTKIFIIKDLVVIKEYYNKIKSSNE